MEYVDKQGKLFVGPLRVGDRMIYNPTEEMLLQAGYTRRTTTETEQHPPVYRFSKYKIKQLLGAEGWELKKAELEAAGLWDDFSLCSYLSTDDALFGPIWENLGEEEKALLIAECRY